MKNETRLTTDNNWREKIHAYREILAELTDQLVEAEAELSEKLAAINTFEFRIRAELSSFTRRLDALRREIDTLRQQLRRAGSAWADDPDEPDDF